MQWFMKEAYEEINSYAPWKHRLTVSAASISVLANQIAGKLGSEYTWNKMGPFGLKAYTPLWFTKTGKDMLEDGGFALDLMPAHDEESQLYFKLAAGKTDFAANPTRAVSLPNTLDGVMDYLVRHEPIHGRNSEFESVHTSVLSVTPDNLQILKDMMRCSSGDEVVKKYGDKIPGLLQNNGEVKDIVFTFVFDDGKELDLEFAINTLEDPPFLVAMLFENGECIGEVQPPQPDLAFPGEFSLVVDNRLYCASFGVLMEHCLYLAGLDNLVEDYTKTLRPLFSQDVALGTKVPLSEQIQSASTRANDSHASLDSPVKNRDPER